MKKDFYQPFHLLTYSPWPIFMSFSLFVEFVGILIFFNNYSYYLMLFGYILLIIFMFQWWRDVVRESTFLGFHTKVVVKGLKMGMILFIISEVFFFISIFWCYFHMFLSPSIEIGGNWPPENIKIFNPFNVPLLNTIILLSSGVTVTLCHYSILLKKYRKMLISMELTLLLGLMFSIFQYLEYCEASFTMADSVFGSIFFMATGFHGLHVILGTLFLLINYFRMLKFNFSSSHHFGFEAAVWYWHFVDVVWLFLYMFVYYWIY